MFLYQNQSNILKWDSVHEIVIPRGCLLITGLTGYEFTLNKLFTVANLH